MKELLYTKREGGGHVNFRLKEKGEENKHYKGKGGVGLPVRLSGTKKGS